MGADIVCATLSTSGSPSILETVYNQLLLPGPDRLRFDAIIIDESCQAVEPSSLIPFKFLNTEVGAKSLVVLLGDPCQLPPTLLGRPGAGEGKPAHGYPAYSTSLFQVTHTCMLYTLIVY